MFDHLPPPFKLMHRGKVIDGLDTVCWFEVSAEKPFPASWGIFCKFIFHSPFPVFLLNYINKFWDLHIVIFVLNETQRMVLSLSSEERN